jgi:hypothetical protein
MSFLSRDERIDQVIAKYRETKRGRAHWIGQLAHMRTLLDGLGSVNWNDPNVSNDLHWHELLKQMRDWNMTWKVGLVQKYEELKMRRVAQDATGNVSIGVLTESGPDLTSHEEEAFAMFAGGAHKWNADFMRHTQRFYQAVELYARTLQRKMDAGCQHAIIRYGNMQFTYIKLLQHVFDVPTIDDFDAMDYEAREDPFLLQMGLQQDAGFIDLLVAAGEYVLWLDEDAMNQTTHYLPDLFHDMVSFYDYIHARLVNGGDDVEDAVSMLDGEHAEGSPEREDDASQETQPMPDDGRAMSRMACLLDQLQLASMG